MKVLSPPGKLMLYKATHQHFFLLIFSSKSKKKCYATYQVLIRPFIFTFSIHIKSQPIFRKNKYNLTKK